MSDENIQRLADNLSADHEGVRARFRQDPVQVLKDHGIELDTDQQEKVRAKAPTLQDEHFSALTTAAISRWF